jgi:hypothetical protein
VSAIYSKYVMKIIDAMVNDPWPMEAVPLQPKPIMVDCYTLHDSVGCVDMQRESRSNHINCHPLSKQEDAALQEVREVGVVFACMHGTPW